VSLLAFLFGAYVGWLAAHAVMHLIQGGPKVSFVETSHTVRYHISMVLLLVSVPLLNVAEWLLVINDEGDQDNG
jgi:hypothetical protein